MVTYDGFKEYIRQRAQEEIGGRVVVNSVRKINGRVLDGLCIMDSGCNIYPSIYLNEYYKELKDTSEPEDETLTRIWQSIKEIYYDHLPQNSFEMKDLMKWESVKERLYIRLINTAKNETLLEDLVNIPYLDLSIIFVVDVAIGDIKGNISIRKELAELWGIGTEEIYKKALENMEDKWEIQPMSEILKHTGGSFELSGDSGVDNIYVLSNKEMFFGASSILIKKVFEENEDLFSCNKLYVIPSSVHELILMSADACEESGTEYINEMIRNVNETLLDDLDFLSDHVYIYDLKGMKLRV